MDLMLVFRAAFSLISLKCRCPKRIDAAQRHGSPPAHTLSKLEIVVKHAVIFAHPNKQNFAGSVAVAYGKDSETQGHTAVTRDLYRMNFRPCLQSEELPFLDGGKPHADVVAERTLLRDVDVFVLVYPLWLGTLPAVMKGYLERVFGYGFSYGKSGRSEPLLGGRKLITFSSSGAPLYWMEKIGAFGAIKTLFDQYFSDVCGLTFVDHVHFGGITPGIREDAVETRLAEVQDTVAKHFGSTE